MTDVPQLGDWRTFYRSLVIEHSRFYEPIPKPTIVDLDRFELETGFRLPRSYREYIRVFGPGELFQDCRIASPCGDQSWGLSEMHANARGLLVERANRYPEEARDVITRGRYFCSGYREYYVWDPAEMTDIETAEYAIWYVASDDEVAHRFANTFREFIAARVRTEHDAIVSREAELGITDGNEPEDEDWYEKDYGPRFAFTPARPYEA